MQDPAQQTTSLTSLKEHHQLPTKMSDIIPPNKAFKPFDPPPGYGEMWAREARRQEELGIPEPDVGMFMHLFISRYILSCN